MRALDASQLESVNVVFKQLLKDKNSTTKRNRKPPSEKTQAKKEFFADLNYAAAHGSDPGDWEETEWQDTLKVVLDKVEDDVSDKLKKLYTDEEIYDLFLDWWRTTGARWR